MVSFTVKATGAGAAAFLLAQQVQCPPLAIPLITSAALQVAAQVGSAGASFAGAIVAGHFADKKRDTTRVVRNRHSRRQDFVAPPGVPQHEFDRCYNDLSSEDVYVTVEGPVETNGIRVDGLPASCMNLATVITGDANGPPPYPCGSACLIYDNLNEEDYNELRSTFDGLKNA